MNVEVVHYQVDRFRVGVGHGQGHGHLSELKTGSIRRGEREMTAGLRLHGAENIGRPATLIFVIPPRLASWRRRRGGPHVRMQGNGLLVSADHRWRWIVRPFVYFQHVFHLGDVVIVEIRHHPHFFPATVSSRGSEAESEWFPFLRVEPVCA